MNLGGSYLQFALRELRAVLRSRMFLGFWLAAIVITFIVGPFGTNDSLTPGWRLLYWCALISFNFVVSALVIAGIIRHPALQHLPSLVRALSGSALIGTLAAIYSWSVDHRIWPDESGLPDFLGYLSVSLPIALAIGSAASFMAKSVAETRDENTSADQPEATEIAFLRRIPVHLGRKLVSVSVQDHYLDVVTEKGRQMILMRFSDALDELQNAGGLQIHRSHWVALDAIADVRRKPSGLEIRLKDGRELPVSRSRLDAVRETLQL